MLRPRGVQSLPLTRRISSQPSPSASKKAAPEPSVSGRYFFPDFPGVVDKLDPRLRRDVGELHWREAAQPLSAASASRKSAAMIPTPLRYPRQLH